MNVQPQPQPRSLARPTPRASFAFGTKVEVRDRYRQSWTHGFTVASTTERGYLLRRDSDQFLLPSGFDAVDVRRRDSVE